VSIRASPLDTPVDPVIMEEAWMAFGEQRA
jgi:hypothetical protein